MVAGMAIAERLVGLVEKIFNRTLHMHRLARNRVKPMLLLDEGPQKRSAVLSAIEVCMEALCEVQAGI